MEIRLGRFVLITLAAVAITAPVFAQSDARVQPPAQVPSQIVGTVTLNGCVPDPTLLEVQVVPLKVQTSRVATSPSNYRPIERFATFAPTADAHTLRFWIQGLNPAEIYQIGVLYPADAAVGPVTPCGKIFWRGPEFGLVVSGGPSIVIEGFAVRTEIEVLENATGRWVGADELNLDSSEAATRTFRWRSSLPGIIGGEVQFSTERFPTRGDFGACDEPRTGVFARRAVFVRGSASDNQAIEPIDFTALLGTRSSDRIGAAVEPAIAPHAMRLLMLGAPLYIRVVPQLADGPACAVKDYGPPGWTMIGKKPGTITVPPPPTVPPAIQPFDGHFYKPPFLGYQTVGPTYGQDGFKVVKPHVLPDFSVAKTPEELSFIKMADPLGSILVTGFGFPQGSVVQDLWFTVAKKIPSASHGNPISQFGSALAGLGGAFGGLVTGTIALGKDFLAYMSNLLNEIETKLAAVVVNVASFVPGVTELCDALESTGKSCDEVVKAGLQSAMVSAGIPPSIPNFDELEKQGFDYLAAEVATEIGDPTGISGEVLMQKAKDIVTETMKKVSASRGGDTPAYDWVVPYLGFDPSVWTISIDKVATPLSPRVLKIPQTSLFVGANVDVPTRFPETNILKIPVVLQPNLDGIPAPECHWNFLTTRTECKPNPWLTAPLCFSIHAAKDIGFEESVTDCSYGNEVGIYYRDAWVTQRLTTTPCTVLAAVSFLDLGSLWLPDDTPFVATALVPPNEFRVWDGAAYNGCK